MIAVMAFTAPAPVAWLSLGVPQILSMKLDGAGELRAVDPSLVLSAAPGAAPAQVAAMIAHLNVQFFVLGSVVPSGQQYSITASVYRRERPDSAIGLAVVEGAMDDLARMLEKLAREILAATGQLDAELRGVAARTPFAALKAYTQGQTLFMAGQYDSAVTAFDRAVTIDSSFAMAYYRLSAAEEWSFDFVPALQHARRAQVLGQRLGLQQERLISPWIAFLEGRFRSALRGYGGVLTSDPNNVEARYGLAEVLIHFNPVRGDSVNVAGPHFDEVLKAVPEFGEARFHALELSARANRDGPF